MKRSLAERFWEKVAKSEDPDGCWLWTAGVDKDGYGVFGVDSKVKTKLANRVAWELLHGPIPAGLLVLHSCDTPACVRHLFLGTPKKNMEDKMAKGREARGDRITAGRVTHRGSAHKRALLTEAQVLEIRKRYIPRKVPLHALAEEFGVSPSGIHYAIHYGWGHVQGVA